MSVAYGLEYGCERGATGALLPQIIGNIQTVTGCGTLRRGSGIAVPVRIGDSVCQGDVIETAADGQIGIRLIDGNTFNIPGGTRLELRAPKSGSLGTDAPAGSIRGRAYAGGFEMLSLTALTFAMMKEVQAADPNVTFIDEDSIAYKDLEHGVFELTTKEAIPRHIIVEDPGETVVLNKIGSSVSVNQVTNSAARMEELRAAQQDVLANLAEGPNGSSTPPSVQSLPLQPINFVPPDAPTPQNSLSPLTPFIPVFQPWLVHVPPTLNALTGPTEHDTSVFDTFSATTGTFSASSTSFDATLTFGISGGTPGSTVLGGVTYNVSEAGPFGTLFLNSTSGAYAFVPNNQAINALKVPTTTSFLITVSDGTLSASETFTININGVEDAAIISGAATGAVTEAGGVANATLGLQTATGMLTDTDPDDPPNTFTAVSSPTRSAGGYGTFTMTTAGVWTYTVDNANSAVQALNVGDTLTDTFTVTSIDGTPKVVTITISGSNDAAIVSGTATGAVIEAGGVANATPGTPVATGTLTDTDVDNPPNTFTAISSPTKSAGGYGTFTITAAGVWTYTLDNTNGAVQALNVGNTLIDTFTVTTIDGTPKVVTITISGSNDAAIISGTATGAVFEAGGVANATPGAATATGTLTDTDVDNPPNTFTAISSPTKSAGGYGTFTITAAGVWTYTLDNTNGAVQALNVGNTLIDTFTVTTIDGTPKVVTITINGSNDAAIISGTTTGSVIEIRGVVNATPGTETATGTLTDTDVDNPPNTFTAISSPTKSVGGYGTFTITAAGVWTYALDDTNSAVQALSVGGVLTDTFTVTSIDGTPQVVTITIHGPLVGVTGTAPSLTLSESHLTATALDDNIAGSAPNVTLTATSGNFSTAFTSVQGVDGATISYALSIAGGNGTASGLIDSHTGQSDVLVLNGNTIEGHVGTAGGTLAFTITLDPTTGLVTFTEFRAVTQPLGTNPDSGEGVSLTPGIVNLTATIAENGDFQTASIDLGSRLTITDDGPAIGGFGETTIVAQDNQIVSATYNATFGADGASAMRVAVHNGAVNGFNLATTDLGGGITSVQVTGNGDDYTFYYTTHAVSGGVELDAFFTDTSGTLSNPFFTLLINPNGTYTFDIESVGFLRQTTVTGSDFGASGGGQLSLTAPDGNLIITGAFNGAPADVKASSNGIAVGDTGLQMDQHETLLLNFTQQQANVSFSLTQWQGNGTADVVFTVSDGATDIHDFNVNIAKPSGDARIVVQETSNPALINTQAFDSATSTYTLYVGSHFNQIGVAYDHAVTGNTTFTVNNITYDEQTTIPSTDLLFDVTAVDRDGDSSTASLQVDLLGGTNPTSGTTSSADTGATALVGGGSNASLPNTLAATTVDGAAQAVTNNAAIISGAVIGSVLAASDAWPGTASVASVDSTTNAITAISSPTSTDSNSGTFAMTAAGVGTYALNGNNSVADALNVGNTPNDHFTVHSIDGTDQVVTINGASNAVSIGVDNPAAGSAITSDPPNEHGIPQSDTVAAASDVGQKVSAGDGNEPVDGTGKSDGNDGNDTIKGGVAADHLSGGNGNGHFVYQSAAHFAAARFDTITDFVSGSDKNGLTALGALGFVILALNSSSTSVPAHTIAWLYDSAANETIVYVNPTDQTLSIGDSSLQEIHLQGIATVQSSDFTTDLPAAPVAAAADPIDPTATMLSDATIVTTAASDALSGAAVNDSTLHADATWTAKTANAFGSFDGDRDQFKWIDDRNLSSSDDVQTHAGESAHDDPTIAPASGPSTNLHHVNVEASIQSGFSDGASAKTIGSEIGTTWGGTIPDIASAALTTAHDQTDLLPDKQGPTRSDSDNEGHGGSIGKDAGSIDSVDAHGHPIDTGSDVGHGSGNLKAAEGGGGGQQPGSGEANGHQSAPGQNSDPRDTDLPSTANGLGHLKAEGGGGNPHSDPSAAGEHSSAHGTGAPDTELPSTANVALVSEPTNSPGSGDSFHFKDKTANGNGSVANDNAGPQNNPAPPDHPETAAGAHGPEAAQTADSSLPDIVSHQAEASVLAHLHHDLIV